jgi:hypothetical protein
VVNNRAALAEQAARCAAPRASGFRSSVGCAHTLNYLQLIYEADLADPARHQSTINLFTDFMNIRSFKTEASLQGLGSSKFQDNIENWDEIEKFLADTDTEFALTLNDPALKTGGFIKPTAHRRPS